MNVKICPVIARASAIPLSSWGFSLKFILDSTSAQGAQVAAAVMQTSN
jgi:hypothetical protein